MEEMNEEEVMETVLEFIDADGLDAAMNNLELAKELSDYLESGLTTQAAIKRTSVELRNILLHVKRSVHKEYANVLSRRADLLGNVGSIQLASKKEALLKAKAELDAKLAALG